MKRVILAAVTLISVAFAGNANAQTTHTDNVIVNIKLRPVYTLVVTGSQKPVDLIYITKDDYNDGVISTQNNHLTVFSTGGFVVNVKSSGDFTNSTDAEKIDANSVSVLAGNGSESPAGGTLTYTKANLSVSDQEIIKSTKGGRDRNFNVTYTGAGSDAYINNFDKDRGATENVYTATVTYTIVAD